MIILFRLVVAFLAFMVSYLGFTAVAVMEANNWKDRVSIGLVLLLSFVTSMIGLMTLLTPVTIE